MGERESRSMLEKPRSMLEVAPKSIFDGYQSPSALLETPRSSGGINHSFGNVSVHPPRTSEAQPPKSGEPSKGSLDWASQSADLGESISKGLENTGAEKTFGSFGDVFNVYKGGSELYGGVSSMLENGVTADNALDTSKGVLDTTAGFAGLLQSSPVKGYAGMASGGIDIYRGLSQAISSSDLDESTAGAYQLVEGIGSTISSYGDKTGNPFLMGGGRALNAGMAIGKPLVAATDRHAVNADLVQDEYGNSTTGSHRAGMAGRDVQSYLNDTWVPKGVGSVAGGISAIGAGIGLSAYSGAHAVGGALYDGAGAVGGAVSDAAGAVGGAVSDAAGAAKDFLFGGPNIMDIMRAQLERQ